MDGSFDRFPQAQFKDASPRATQINFHPRTREACQSRSLMGNITSKIIAIGDIGVGKTCLINRYSHNTFEKDYKPTIGVEYEMKKFSILNTPFHLQIWDTSGEERFKAITNAYYRGSHAILIAFDLTDSLTLNNARTWLDEALSNTRTTIPEIFLIGTKKDLCKSRQLEQMREEAKNASVEMNAEYWEVSAKTGTNVKELFTRVSAICFDQGVLREVGNRREKDEKTKLGNATGENGMQTIQLGKSNLEKDQASLSKRGCCKTS